MLCVIRCIDSKLKKRPQFFLCKQNLISKKNVILKKSCIFLKIVYATLILIHNDFEDIVIAARFGTLTNV